MIRINEHYLKLKASYLFSDIAKRVTAYQQRHPDSPIIRLGIGDVTHALPKACIEAFHQAVDEMATDTTFRGYGPEQGYEFLRQAIAENDFKSRGADISTDEIFISDGAKCDTGNIQEIFDINSRIAIPDPVYPVYLDTNVMAGRTGAFQDGRYEGIVYLDSHAENQFIPDLPSEPVDLIYLCFPNNPTGVTISSDQLKKWVDFAVANKAIILFDAAYEAFIRDDRLPHSIYEIEGARQVAIEFRSFSKTAGFTGTRCAYTVVPKSLQVTTSSGDKISIHDLWNRRQSTKFNGVSYPVQRAAAATYSNAGKQQVAELIDGYMTNAALIRKSMQTLGYGCVGGENSPYIWVSTGQDSWGFFDMLLEKAGVVCTPGAGFGNCGEGYIRISAFNSHENVTTALARISQALTP
ncbi:DapL: LL-diaminopimelate aminotransferase (LL-DAP-aminotransferase) [Desulfosarcina variabilis str. Montpellier]|uniref:LL-diaminopimelate aminotransferase n=1 Tax=Desulfosarcina variabilis TaxID=2300 RepID=UPI003AFA7F8E